MKRIRPAALAIAAAAAAPALAGEYQAQMYVTAAAGACQSALPVYDTMLRKRPLAVQNEGDSTTFVTCAVNNPIAHAGSPLRVSSHRANVVNLNDAPVQVTCTLVKDIWSTDPMYFTQTIQVSKRGEDTLWFVEGPTNGVTAISCGLPPGTGVISIVHTEWNGIPMGQRGATGR